MGGTEEVSFGLLLSCLDNAVILFFFFLSFFSQKPECYKKKDVFVYKSLESTSCRRDFFFKKTFFFFLRLHESIDVGTLSSDLFRIE